ncbi:hypothetical protein [Flavivirga spongiicola]|uniref:Uncharacterized protein n=1 Tax=Flavivirga spongiicola TaxID=421621 RepID=A0ABU7XQL7_9FLAO|nr:hypothetical protein [Flavivirga sp. MEBiC05379]MDO5978079.1 hypothetical protein [Flavivirga sp. MEBiC05379]
MKKLGYLLIFVILGSCMNNKDENRESAAPMMVEESDDLSGYETKNTGFSITTLAEQKLQEYYDLSLLQKHHPEFENDIKLQLNKLADTLLILPNTTREIIIKNVTKIDYQKITDSTSKLRLHYEVISDRGNTFDTISAIIKTKTIMVNNETITTRKLTFINK